MAAWRLQHRVKLQRPVPLQSATRLYDSPSGAHASDEEHGAREPTAIRDEGNAPSGKWGRQVVQMSQILDVSGDIKGAAGRWLLYETK